MKPFLDLVGRSGASYRLKLAAPDRLPTTAGNFVFLRASASGEQVVCCGTARSLTRAAGLWTTAVEQHRANRIYVRLNVSREAREREHEDLLGALQPVMVAAELD
ncbi:MAG: hypothetical protein Q8Q88_06315 [Phenylobacterium sp.]|uniref:hypothetical protein n=1 Tax=Phenylobacterium sp. TaxID=1871053 RepID=UPI0027326327|nr:hypothetical protein [Phenylobacterium sp.]MDP3746648.1 hypothetical protein [Phenylobacterium sp.]